MLCLLMAFLPWAGIMSYAQTSATTSDQKTQTRITVTGQVIDSITGQPIEFVNIAELGTGGGTMSDGDGRFSLLSRPGSKIAFSCLGYESQQVVARSQRGSRDRRGLTVRLKPTNVQLQEVVVKRRRERYRRKDNPAVALIRQVIAHKDKHWRDASDHLIQTRYDNTTYSLNNFNDNHQKRWRKRFDFIDHYVDTALVSGVPVLPVSTNETLELHRYQRSPRRRDVERLWEQHAGMDDMFPEEMVRLLKTDLFGELDLHEDNMYLFRKKFVSPISSFGPLFYKYYILDTVSIDNSRYVDLGFAPSLPQSYGFVGHLYISLDTTYFVRRAVMNIPPDINLNWVRNMHVECEMGRLPDSTQVLVRQTFDSELNITSGSMGLYAHRVIAYGDFDTSGAQTVILGPKHVPLPEVARVAACLTDYRRASGYDEDRSVDKMMKQMRRIGWYKYTEMVLGYLFRGFVPVDDADEKAKFMVGPVNAIASWNKLEHLRLRAGGITTAKLNPHLFFSGYGAYGIEDHKWKYNAEVEYSFRRKQMYPSEFPIHSLKASHRFDSHELGLELTTGRDNFVNSLRRASDPKFIYERETSLDYTLEFRNHFSINLRGTFLREYPSRLGVFEKVGTGLAVPHHDFALGEVHLRWAPRERFAQMRTSRIRVDSRHPIFSLTYRYAKAGVLGSDFDLHSLDFSYQQRLWLSVLGYMDTRIDCGKLFSQTPYTHLYIPQSNQGYTIQKNSFSQLESMEFVYDQYARWDLGWHLNGLLFNNIPYLRHLKLREILSFRGVVGSLSERNDPEALLADGSWRNPDLYRLPTNGTVYRLDRMPYMEAAVGIDNIFKVLRVEYIRRLTYLDHPGVSKNGVQVAISISF